MWKTKIVKGKEDWKECKYPNLFYFLIEELVLPKID